MGVKALFAQDTFPEQIRGRICIHPPPLPPPTPPNTHTRALEESPASCLFRKPWKEIEVWQRRAACWREGGVWGSGRGLGGARSVQGNED